MYDSIRRVFNWLHVPDDIYMTVCDCQQCSRNQRTTKRQCKRCLFSPTKPLKFVVIGMLAFLRKTKTGNQFIVVLTDGFMKLFKATNVSKVVNQHVFNLNSFFGFIFFNDEIDFNDFD